MATGLLVSIASSVRTSCDQFNGISFSDHGPGERRLIYGSNWPCSKKSGDYASFVRLVNRYFAGKGQEVSERFFWKNAAEAYRLELE